MTEDLSTERARIQSLVASQSALIKDRGTRDALLSCLVEPQPQTLEWPYGGGLETYQCWVVAELTPSGAAIGYSEQGFGPRAPWGLIWLDDANPGQDSGWFRTLHEAYLDSFGWQPREITLDPAAWQTADDVLDALFVALRLPTDRSPSVGALVEAIKQCDGNEIGLPIEIYVLHTEDRDPAVAEFLFHLAWNTIGALTREGYSIRLIPNWLSDPTML